MAKRKKKFEIDLKKEIEKINFKHLATEEHAEKYYGAKIIVLDKEKKYSFSKEKPINRVIKNLVTYLIFENRKDGLRITVDGLNSYGFTFVLKRWDRNKALANMICCMQMLSVPVTPPNSKAETQPSYMRVRRRRQQYQTVDRARRNALVKAFDDSKENYKLPTYMVELLKQLKIIIDNEAIEGREAVKRQVTSSFKILMDYGYEEQDVLCLWREIVAEQIVDS